MQEFSLKSGVNTPLLEVDVGDGSRLEADRITKKVRFKGGTDEEAMNMMVESDSSPKLSWKDKLLGTKSGVSDKEELGSSSVDSDEDIEILEGNIHRSIVNGIPAIDFSERIQHILFKKMERTVVLKLLRRNIGYEALNNRISSLWNPSKPFHFMDIENGYFLAKFQSINDYTKVLTQGPWLIYGQYLTVQPWTKEFSPSQPYPSTEIGGTIGKVVRLDLNTNSRIKGRFARMVVYINLDKPLIAQVLVNGMKQRVEYEALPTICFTYGKPLNSHKVGTGPNGLMGQLIGASVESYATDGPLSSRPLVDYLKNKEIQAIIAVGPTRTKADHNGFEAGSTHLHSTDSGLNFKTAEGGFNIKDNISIPNSVINSCFNPVFVVHEVNVTDESSMVSESATLMSDLVELQVTDSSGGSDQNKHTAVSFKEKGPATGATKNQSTGKLMGGKDGSFWATRKINKITYAKRNYFKNKNSSKIPLSHSMSRLAQSVSKLKSDDSGGPDPSTGKGF
ncbi:hypothetical protein GOBAR_AA25035 [Gossypium barbadense]|uniref:DUF4283 domain-containing protein n=1 Tax=Gossypium barbadense TaxID=3634 RepID=A0A2P5WX21_GOSBA|nr:hypothetical protein GOBAR_AA25035 [Gossypium barbadense]